MKKVLILLTLLFFAINLELNAGKITSQSAGQETFTDEVHFSVLEGYIRMTLRRTDSDFQCIGIQYSDKNLNMSMGTCLELKREGNKYVVEIQYKKERFRKIDKAIEAYIKDLIIWNYERYEVPGGDKVWKDFVKDGGLRRFIEVVKPWMDDEYLDSPWNTIYG